MAKNLGQKIPAQERCGGHDLVLLGMGILKWCCEGGTVEVAGLGVEAEGTELETSVSWHQLVALRHLGYPAKRKSRKSLQLTSKRNPFARLGVEEAKQDDRSAPHNC